MNPTQAFVNRKLCIFSWNCFSLFYQQKTFSDAILNPPSIIFKPLLHPSPPRSHHQQPSPPPPPQSFLFFNILFPLPQSAQSLILTYCPPFNYLFIYLFFCLLISWFPSLPPRSISCFLQALMLFTLDLLSSIFVYQNFFSWMSRVCFSNCFIPYKCSLYDDTMHMGGHKCISLLLCQVLSKLCRQSHHHYFAKCYLI